ncbi:MAG: hypothetical protein ACRD0D_01590, partial [Acidimicrobiales bacterium]
MARIRLKYFTWSRRVRVRSSAKPSRGANGLATSTGFSSRWASRCTFTTASRPRLASNPSMVWAARWRSWMARVWARFSSTVSTMQRFNSSSSTSAAVVVV